MKSIYLILIIAFFTESVYLEKKEKSGEVGLQIMASSMPGCGCASQFPACCTPEFNAFSCDCAPRPSCDACPGNENNMFVHLHDSMLKMAMKDAYNQQDLAQKAKLQVDLFQKAQEYAKEVGVQEMKAKQFANILNEATRKAQFSRAMMFQAATQVRVLADQTIRAIQPMKCIGQRCGAGMGIGMHQDMAVGMSPEMSDPIAAQANELMNDMNNMNNLR